MTAQIGDIYKHKEQKYKLIALSAKNPFCPEQYGMVPHMSSTACRSGYWCQYTVDDVLRLDELYLYNLDGEYPSINGIEADPVEYEEVIGYSINGEVRRTRPKYDGHRAYRSINLEIPYTGKILLGKDIIKGYIVHMGFQNYWSYNELAELTFEDGVLVNIRDCSSYAQRQREIMAEKGINPRYPELADEDINLFIENSFSLDYSVKAKFLEIDDLI